MYQNTFASQSTWLVSEVLLGSAVQKFPSYKSFVSSSLEWPIGIIILLTAHCFKFFPVIIYFLLHFFLKHICAMYCLGKISHFWFSVRFESRGWDSASQWWSCIRLPKGWNNGCIFKPSPDLERQHPAPLGPSGAVLLSTPALWCGAGPSHGHLLTEPR